jgi:hypothetical protein
MTQSSHSISDRRTILLLGALERHLMKQLRYIVPYRWLIGLVTDDRVWDHSTIRKNRDRLLEHAVVECCFAEVMTLADKRALLSKGHVSVDDRLTEAWASQKGYAPKDGSSDEANGGGVGRTAQFNWKGNSFRNVTRIAGNGIDARTTRHPGYAMSRTTRKRIEEHFGWGKTFGRIRQTVYRGLAAPISILSSP